MLYDKTVHRESVIYINQKIKSLNKLATIASTTPKNDILVLNSENVDNEGQESKNCEVIHIGMVSSGYKSIYQLYTLLKSIYLYRVNPIHFHILTNKLSSNVLQILFDTWQIPQSNVTFYQINDLIADVRWIPNSHYSGIHGLLKLLFPKIIPIKLTKKIIILDTDLTFITDIYELWRLFENFTQKQSLGIVENQSDYYLGKNSRTKPWPALGRGFNSGVLLYDLEKLQLIHWQQLWTNVTKTTALIYGSTRLGDQDIINTIILRNPEILYKVPCYFNTQLSDHSISYENCYKNKRGIKIIHWNSPKKLHVTHKDGDYFRNLHRIFLEMNGNLLQKQLYYCDKPQDPQDVIFDQCSTFNAALKTKWRTLLFFRNNNFNTNNNDIYSNYDVTFVAQLSYDRLFMVEDLIKYWNGPISLTFYITDYELDKLSQFIDNSQLLQDRSNIAYHAVFKQGEYYPINILRNVGLRNVYTPYVFLADIDFIPMRNLYIMIKNYLIQMKSLKYKVLIVPAFETQQYKLNIIPKNKRQLLHQLEKKTIMPFRFDVWYSGHAPTNYTKWKAATNSYQVKWQPDFEPYIVVRSDVTEYDERFMGFGWNKVSHIMELEAQNYEFIVLPDVFIIHKPHTPSYDIGKFRTSPIYRMCLQNLKEAFVQKLFKKYGRVFDKNINNSRNVSLFHIIT